MQVKHFCTPCAKTILPKLSPSVPWKPLFPLPHTGWMGALCSSLPWLGRWVSQSNESQKKQELHKEGLLSSATKAWEHTIATSCFPDQPKEGTLVHCRKNSKVAPFLKNNCHHAAQVTESVGYQVFRQGLQLPRSAIAANPWNLVSPLAWWHLALPLPCKRIQDSCQAVCRNTTPQQRIPLKKELKQGGWHATLCPLPPWTDMILVCNVKEMICKTVSEKQRIAT